MSNAHLTETIFASANLSNVILSNAKIVKTNFCHTNLSGARLFNTNISDVEFLNVDLTGSILQESKINNSIFLGPRIRFKGMQLDPSLDFSNSITDNKGFYNFLGKSIQSGNLPIFCSSKKKLREELLKSFSKSVNDFEVDSLLNSLRS